MPGGWIVEGCNSNLFKDCFTASPSAGHFLASEISLSTLRVRGVSFLCSAQCYCCAEKKPYGEHWNVPDRYGRGQWSSPDDIHSVSSSGTEQTPHRVYVDVVGDLFHFGHVRLFKRARQMGKMLVVGVHNDSTVASYKREPILTMQERKAVIESCKYVDEIVPHAPLVVTDAFLDRWKIDLVVRGDDQLPDVSRKSYGAAMERGIFRTVPYTESISTSEILRRIFQRGRDLNKERNRLNAVDFP